MDRDVLMGSGTLILSTHGLSKQTLQQRRRNHQPVDFLEDSIHVWKRLSVTELWESSVAYHLVDCLLRFRIHVLMYGHCEDERLENDLSLQCRGTEIGIKSGAVTGFG